jgi:hypothetical protein
MRQTEIEVRRERFGPVVDGEPDIEHCSGSISGETCALSKALAKIVPVSKSAA